MKRTKAKKDVFPAIRKMILSAKTKDDITTVFIILALSAERLTDEKYFALIGIADEMAEQIENAARRQSRRLPLTIYN